MKNKLLTSVIVVVLALFTIQVSAQNAKKYLKTGETFVKSENYKDAIEHFTKAIEFDPELTDAYIARAQAYEKIHKIDLAAEDYYKVTVLDPKSEENFYHAGRLYNLLGKNEKAAKLASDALAINKKYLEAFDVKINALIALDKLDDALAESNLAIEIKRNDQTYKNRAKVFYLMGKFEEAEKDFNSAFARDNKNEEIITGLANTQYELDKLNDALTTINLLIDIDENSKQGYLVRSKIYQKKVDFPNAINDISKLIVLYPNDPQAETFYQRRGILYLEFNQHVNAINDFTKVITLNPKNYLAYFKRAASYEAITKYDNAIADYEHVENMNIRSIEAQDLIKDAKQRLFELKKEENQPVIVLDEPIINEKGEAEIVNGIAQTTIKGKIQDESPIDYLKVNGNNVIIPEDSKDNEFSTTITVNNKEDFTIEVSDVYQNITTKKYIIKRTEIDPPAIALVAPYASDNNVIYLESDDPTMYFEGTITDASKIKQILVEGATASYVIDQLNPTFTATVSVLNKDKVTIKAVDVYGNEKVEEFLLNREGAGLLAENPMGKTWVVFIENSNYKSFSSLDGPAKDVTTMKSAFAKYQINNIIHKKDMSKAEMQKFFSIELRDMVKSNNVNSVLVWYAGHGKFVNETGYWIPVDATRDDEFTYFNINNLKAAMQSYSKYITHTLVVTDACESGPSFYQAMRSTPKERSCGDWAATKFKSSQVFSSAGYELASDKSQFTKTFASSLIYNPDKCIPIENIVLKVTNAVVKNNTQKPKFGKIAGLEDENGTFFFMKK